LESVAVTRQQDIEQQQLSDILACAVLGDLDWQPSDLESH
jgi:hypothetical protein